MTTAQTGAQLYPIMRKLMNYSWLVLILSALAFSTAVGQKTAGKKPPKVQKSSADRTGDKYFDLEEYSQSAEEYQRAIRKDPNNFYSYWKMGEAYRNIFQYVKAEEAYAKAEELGGAQAIPLLDFRYGEVLKINGKYDQAQTYLQKFADNFQAMRPSEMAYAPMAKTELEGSKLALSELQKQFPNFQLEALPEPINSKFMDYAPAIFTNDSIIVFTSHRPEGRGSASEPRSGERFSDNFMFMRKNGKWVPDTTDSDFKGLNTKVNDGAGVFNFQKNKFYYTSCSDEEACQLYVAEFKNGAWDDPVPLNDNINDPKYSSKQPCLSFTGDTLWFVSDRPGGEGLNDIWYSTKAPGTEDWEEPINMGKTINTPFVDMSPSYYPAERLFFFASNGQAGLGGLDIFMTQLPALSPIKNIGIPFNSNRDDFYFVIGQKDGYLTSNRDGGQGGDDIYRFRIFDVADKVKDAILNKEYFAKNPKKPLPPDTAGKSVDVSGVVKDDKGNPKPNTTVQLKDEQNKVIAEATSDEKGNVIFKNQKPNKYKLALLKKQKADSIAKASHLAKLELEREKREKAAALALERLEKQKLAKAHNKAFADSLLAVKAEAKRRKKAFADSLAEARKQLAQTTKEKDEPAEEVTTTIKQVNRKPTRFLYENIYFEFDSYDLRPEAVKTLDDIIAYVKANPKTQIELNAYTDNIGSAQYNAMLSKIRADAAKNYLIDNGIGVNNLIVNARGMGKPVASNNSTVGRALNRRVEFYVLGGGDRPETNSAMAYVSTSAQSIDEVAKRFNMTREELKAMNNLSGNELKAFQPVRVKRQVGSKQVIAATALETAKNSDNNKPELMASTSNASAPAKALDNNKFTASSDATIYTIARLFGMSASDLKADNNLQSASISAGQQIMVRKTNPRKGFYLVKAGDTFQSIADANGISLENLIKKNKLEGETLYEGMHLAINNGVRFQNP